MPHIRVSESGEHWFKLWLVASSAPCHYLNNARLLSIGPLGRNFYEILIKIQKFSFTKNHMNISSAKWRPFCPGGDELIRPVCVTMLLMYLNYVPADVWISNDDKSSGGALSIVELAVIKYQCSPWVIPNRWLDSMWPTRSCETCFGTCPAPSHHISQCSVIVNWNPGNKIFGPC